MKFTKNRLLSLLLVLAMMLALVPSVFATDPVEATSVTLSPSTATVEVGKNTTLTATMAPEGSTGALVWSSSNDNIATVNGGVVSGVAPGTATITVKLGAGGTDDTEKVCNVTVTKATINLTSDLQSVVKTFQKFSSNDSRNEETIKSELTAIFNTQLANASTFSYKDQIVLGSWTSTSGTFDDESKKSNGSMTYTADIQLKQGVDENKYEIGSTKTVTATVSFNDLPSTSFDEYKVNGTAGKELSCKQNEADNAKKVLSLKLKDLTDGATVKYQWFYGTSSRSVTTALGEEATLTTVTDVITCNPKVDVPGIYYYVCKVKLSKNGLEATYPSEAFTVKVNAQYTLSVDRSTTTGTSTPHVGDILYYTATLRVYDPSNAKADKTTGYRLATDTDYDSIVFTPVTTGNAATTATSSTNKIMATSVYLNGVSSSTLTSSNLSIKATVKKGSTTLIEGESASITFYPVSTRDVYIAPTTATYATMDESSLLSAVQYVRTGAQPRQMIFRSNCGTFNYSNPYTSYYALSVTNRVSNTTFTPNTYNYANFSNNPTATFYATDDNGNYVVATGTIRFSAASSITYSTTASTPVYFKASDFTDFFKTAVGGTYNSSYYTLSEVTFGTPRVSNSSVTSGTLYYNNGYVYSTTKVPAANLGYVSYTPSSSTYTYTVSIPFTAYGTYYYGSTATKTVSGTVTIKVNDGHVITMVGTDFKSASIWSDITSKHPGVSYVSFSQPQSTVGKLYYGYSSIASKGSLVSYTDRFNNSNYNYSYANTIKSIDGIYFVPAADCLDTVTLTYTAYTSATATTGVSDTITFTITKKTASSIFNDVTASNTGKWSADAIDFLARNSIVEGGSYGTFNPNGNMTRGDFVLMLYRMAGKPSVSGISNPFTDVKSSDYYYNAILWAYRNDIVTGVDAKTFAPKKNITREQIAATLYRMAGSPSTSGYLTGYYDYAKIHSYATNAMRWAISNGVITGSNGYLTPTNNATRAQVATMLHRYLTK